MQLSGYELPEARRILSESEFHCREELLKQLSSLAALLDRFRHIAREQHLRCFLSPYTGLGDDPWNLTRLRALYASRPPRRGTMESSTILRRGFYRIKMAPRWLLWLIGGSPTYLRDERQTPHPLLGHSVTDLSSTLPSMLVRGPSPFQKYVADLFGVPWQAINFPSLHQAIQAHGWVAFPRVKETEWRGERDPRCILWLRHRYHPRHPSTTTRWVYLTTPDRDHPKGSVDPYDGIAGCGAVVALTVDLLNLT